MRVLILSFLLVGCVHTRTKVVEDKVEAAALRKEFSRLSYIVQNDMCFTMYGICLAKKEEDKKVCFSKHEKCVVDTYSQWRKLIE